jgi:hypothetical protein
MAKRKRGNSEGSIYKMQDGRWRAAVTTGKDANGKPKRKTFTAATRHEVAEQMTDALRDQQRGININPGKQTGWRVPDVLAEGCGKARRAPQDLPHVRGFRETSSKAGPRVDSTCQALAAARTRIPE